MTLPTPNYNPELPLRIMHGDSGSLQEEVVYGSNYVLQPMMVPDRHKRG